MEGAGKPATRAGALLGSIGAVALFGMMMLTFADVVLRYAFNAPLPGAFEVTELMLVVLIFSGLPLVSLNDKHVTTDLVDRLLTAHLRRANAVLAHLVFCAALLGVGWLIWSKAGKLAEVGDTTQILRILLAPFVYLMSALLFVTAVIHLVKALRAGRIEGDSRDA